MKKLVCLVLCFLMIAGMAIPALAADNQTELTLTVPEDLETYTLTIPATVALDVANGTGAVEVKLSNVNLVWSNCVSVAVASANNCYLVNEENEQLKMEYQITSTATNDITNAEDYYPLNGVADYREGQYHNGSLEIKVLDTYPGAGTYRDTLTFFCNH